MNSPSARAVMPVPAFATILDALEHRAREAPEAMAYAVVNGGRMTYAQLARDSARLAAELASLGISSGQPVGIRLPTSLAALRILFALQRLGAAPVFLNYHLPLPTALRRMSRIGARAIVLSDEEAADPALRELSSGNLAVLRLSDLPAAASIQSGQPVVAAPEFPPPSPESIAFLQITSGTTGEPKAACVLHRNLIASLRSSVRVIDGGPDDIFVSWVPLYHDLGIVRFVFLPLYMGRPSHLLQPSIKNLGTWLRTIERVGGTVTGAPDFGYRIATRSVVPGDASLSSLRVATNGGEPVRASTIEAFESRFNVPGVIRPGYGMAEATLGATSLPPGVPLSIDAQGHVGCGRPVEAMQIRIVDAEGRPMTEPGALGEIELSGPMIFAGYWQDPETTAEVLRDGWLRTGDIGYLNADGQLFVLGRRRAMIKRGGAMIAPREIEENVDTLPDVRLSAAIGRVSPSAEIGEQVVVVAEIDPETVTPGEARDALTAAISESVVNSIGAAPAHILLVAPRTIPRTANGKIRYGELRRLDEEGKLVRLN